MVSWSLIMRERERERDLFRELIDNTTFCDQEMTWREIHSILHLSCSYWPLIEQLSQLCLPYITAFDVTCWRSKHMHCMWQCYRVGSVSIKPTPDLAIVPKFSFNREFSIMWHLSWAPNAGVSCLIKLFYDYNLCKLLSIFETTFFSQLPKWHPTTPSSIFMF